MMIIQLRPLDENSIAARCDVDIELTTHTQPVCWDDEVRNAALSVNVTQRRAADPTI